MDENSEQEFDPIGAPAPKAASEETVVAMPAARVLRPLSMTSRIIGGIGRVLITSGVLILLFVVYQLWGTGIREAASQDALKNEFAAIEHAVPVVPTTLATTTLAPVVGDSTTSTAVASTTTTTPAKAATGTADPSAPPKTGAGIAHIVIPKIGVDKYIVQGVSVDDLKRAPGHYANTVFPGQIGNSAIAGHRTTYGAPFNRLDELANGDEIKITTLQGTFTYVVDGQKVVDPSDVSVLDNTPNEARLTLTTCNPKYSAATRLIIMAKLQDGGATMFLADMDRPGIRVERSMSSLDTCFPGGHGVVNFANLRVPAADILGEVGQGFRYAQVRLSPARLTHCMRWLGAARRAHDVATAYARTRHAFGKPIGEHEGIGFMLADNEMDLHAARLSVWHCAWVLDQGALGKHESSVAKVIASEAIWRVVDRSVQILGGQGVTGETVVARIFADVRAFRIYDGPSEVHRWSIARRILKGSRPAKSLPE